MAMVRFEDVATRVNTREDRFNTALTYYVGGDHIETGELKVAGRGVIREADLGPMFYFGFKPGDLLFVTRNPHLRKCAMVDFPGICSEKTLVIATKDENMLYQKYLAAVMQSDDFWEFMEENKSGSVNYFVNWSTLADYEFDLPPIERQRELADLLWAANDLKEAYKKAISATDEMLKAKFRKMFIDENAENAKPKVNLLQAGECKNGLNFTSNESGHTVKCVGVSDFSDDEKLVKLSEVASVSVREIPPETMMLRDKDFVFVRSNGNNALVGRCKMVMPGQNKVVFGGFCIRYRLTEPRILHDWLLYFFRSDKVHHALQGRGAGGSIHNLSQGILSQIDVPIPSLPQQHEFVAIAEKAESLKTALKESVGDLDQVMKGLING